MSTIWRQCFQLQIQLPSVRDLVALLRSKVAPCKPWTEGTWFAVNIKLSFYTKIGFHDKSAVAGAKRANPPLWYANQCARLPGPRAKTAFYARKAFFHYQRLVSVDQDRPINYPRKGQKHWPIHLMLEYKPLQVVSMVCVCRRGSFMIFFSLSKDEWIKIQMSISHYHIWPLIYVLEKWSGQVAKQQRRDKQPPSTTRAPEALSARLQWAKNKIYGQRHILWPLTV